MKFGIEYVCTGNGGRSPTAETLARDYVLCKNLEDKISIFSSGTAAKATEEDLFSFPAEFLIEAIEIGLNSGTYQGKIREKAKRIVENKKAYLRAMDRSNSEGGIESFGRSNPESVETCIQYLMADEVAKRNNILLEIGLVPKGHFHQQTVVRPDVQLILPMKQSNAAIVKKIYDGSGLSPVIVPICEYAGIDGEISDPFGQGIEEYRKTRDLIADAVKKTIDRAAKESGIEKIRWTDG